MSQSTYLPYRWLVGYPSPMRPNLPFLFATALTITQIGCLQDEPDFDASMPGDILGTYQVHAIMLESSCGTEAMGSPDVWDFSVRLARDGQALYWGNGSEVIEGRLDTDGVNFVFESEVLVEAVEAVRGKGGCILRREDHASGALSDTSDVAGFTGELSYSFSQDPGSECLEVLLETGITSLPCKMDYSLAAARSE